MRSSGNRFAAAVSIAVIAILSLAALPSEAANAPIMQSAVSRKVHGTAGAFDLPLALVATNPTTEPRVGPSQTIVFQFDKQVVGGAAAVTEGTAAVGAVTFVGNEMRVPLSGVTNAQYVTLVANNVASADGGAGGTGSVRIGFLAGDVNGNRNVSLSDLLAVDAVLSQPVSSSNFLRDVNTSGTLSLSDLLAIDAKLSQALPLPNGNSTDCQGFNKTIVLDLNWAAPMRLYSKYVGGGFGLSDALIVRFTTGSKSSTNDLPHITVADFDSQPTSRTATLSPSPCDFSTQPAPAANMQGNTITAVFAVGDGPGAPFYPVLNTNTTYYLNIRNDQDSTCTVGVSCDVSVDLINPGAR